MSAIRRYRCEYTDTHINTSITDDNYLYKHKINTYDVI